jgi:hypothetical protein
MSRIITPAVFLAASLVHERDSARACRSGAAFFERVRAGSFAGATAGTSQHVRPFGLPRRVDEPAITSSFQAVTSARSMLMQRAIN